MDTTAQRNGYTLPAGQGERIWIVGDTMTLKATSELTDGNLVLLENVTSPDGGPPPHSHEREDEFFYVVDGAFEIRIGDEIHAVGPGGFAFVPRGTVHCFRNTTGSPARILIGFTPGNIDGFFREAGRPASDDGPAPAFGPDELARTEVAAPKYGLRLAAPGAVATEGS